MSQSLSHSQLVELADRFGTPLYVYQAEKIKEQYDTLKKAFKECNAKFFYACKALTNILLVLVCSIEVKSWGMRTKPD